MSDIDDIIETGIVFKGAPKGPKRDDKVKTKAKKKSISPALMVPVRQNKRPSTVNNGRSASRSNTIKKKSIETKKLYASRRIAFLFSLPIG